MNGVQAGSPSVLGLPSVSPSWIAVIGRQKLQYALSSQQLIRPSAPARFSIAKRRACSTSVSPSSCGDRAERAVEQLDGIDDVELGDGLLLRRPKVRRQLPCRCPPSAFTSLYSFAYAPLVSACGPLRPELRRVSRAGTARPCATQANGSLTPPGDVGRHSPASVADFERNRHVAAVVRARVEHRLGGCGARREPPVGVRARPQRRRSRQRGRPSQSSGRPAVVPAAARVTSPTSTSCAAVATAAAFEAIAGAGGRSARYGCSRRRSC